MNHTIKSFILTSVIILSGISDVAAMLPGGVAWTQAIDAICNRTTFSPNIKKRVQAEFSRLTTRSPELKNHIFDCGEMLSVINCQVKKRGNINYRCSGFYNNLNDRWETTLLHFVVRYTQDTLKIQRVLDLGGDVDALDDQGRTPLFYASTYDQAKLLLDKGADATVLDNQGNTTLNCILQTPTTTCFDVSSQAKNIYLLLVNHGADPHKRPTTKDGVSVVVFFQAEADWIDVNYPDKDTAPKLQCQKCKRPKHRCRQDAVAQLTTARTNYFTGLIALLRAPLGSGPVMVLSGY